MKTATKKITRATLKSFISNNRNNLFAICKSDFDGMVDCVMNVEQSPVKVDASLIDFNKSNTFGIKAIWLVGRSRDWFYEYEDAIFKGIRISNCCGSSIVAIIK